MGLTRGHIEIMPVFTGRTLNVGALTTYSDGFPLGEGIRRLICRVNIAVVIGTGTGAIAEGELLFIKGFNFKTAKGEKPFNLIPGRALWRIDQAKSNTLNYKDAIAAATATYTVQFNAWFSDPLMNNPDDTILDTARYDSVQMDITIGTVADLFTTVGTSSVTATMDMYVERVRGALPKKARPKDFVEYTMPAPANPASTTEINFEKGADLAIKRVYLTATNSATLGTAFTGTPSNTTLADISVDTNEGRYWDTLLFPIANNMNKAEYQFESSQTGQVIIDFVKGGSIYEAVHAGTKSRFKIVWTNGSLSTSQVQCVVEGLRPLKYIAGYDEPESV